MKRFFIGALVLLAVLTIAQIQPTLAVATPFATRAAFDAAFPSAVVENWDSFASGTTFANGSTTNGVTYNSSNGNALVTNSFLVTTSSNGLGESTNGFFLSTDTMTFSFPTAQQAFGIDINTFDTVNGGYRATTNTGEIIGSFFNPFPGFGTGQFLGFSTPSPFTSLTIAAPGGFSYTLDTLRRVPEPTSLLLLASGLMSLIGYQRTRSKR